MCFLVQKWWIWWNRIFVKNDTFLQFFTKKFSLCFFLKPRITRFDKKKTLLHKMWQKKTFCAKMCKICVFLSKNARWAVPLFWSNFEKKKCQKKYKKIPKIPKNHVFLSFFYKKHRFFHFWIFLFPVKRLFWHFFAHEKVTISTALGGGRKKFSRHP